MREFGRLIWDSSECSDGSMFLLLSHCMLNVSVYFTLTKFRFDCGVKWYIHISSIVIYWLKHLKSRCSWLLTQNFVKIDAIKINVSTCRNGAPTTGWLLLTTTFSAISNTNSFLYTFRVYIWIELRRDNCMRIASETLVADKRRPTNFLEIFFWSGMMDPWLVHIQIDAKFLFSTTDQLYLSMTNWSNKWIDRHNL